MAKEIVVKNYSKNVRFLSEEFSAGLVFMACNPREEVVNNRPTGKMLYDVICYSENFEDNFTITLENPVPKEINKFSSIDFENAVVTYKGAYGGQLPNGGHFCRLQIGVTAERVLPKSQAHTSVTDNKAGQNK